MLLICMTISGTMPLILCILIWIIKRKNFSYRLGRKLVLLSLAGYLIPFQLVKYLLPQDMLEDIHSLRHISYFVNFDDKEAISYHGISLWMKDWLLLLILCWLFLIIGFTIYEIIKYQQLTRSLKRNSKCESCLIEGIGEVKYRTSTELDSPYTIGFVKPFILFPEQSKQRELTELLLKHEYSHLQRRDSMVKLLCLLAICLHFFNPLAILTLLLYTSFSEYVADEAATDGCSKEECKAYAIALVMHSAKTRQIPVVWRNNLMGDQKSIKRRVEYIMKRNKKTSKLGVTAAILASMLLSSSTVLAYTPMQTVRTHYDNNEAAEMGSLSFHQNEVTSDLNSSSYITFTNEYNNTILLDESNLDSTRAIICIHNFESGYADVHYPKSDGSCVIKTYRAKHCTKCNHYELYEVVNTITYAKCIHK